MPSPQNASAAPDVEGYGPLSVLASGAFSTVYRTTNDTSGDKVAIKVLNGRLLSDSDQLTFQREIEAMASLAGHPNIVDLLDYGYTESERPFLVMPLYRHGTFGSMVDRDGPMRWQDLISFGIKTAGAVESVHRGGFVHRDIKPANIFRGDALTDPVLADFGVSSFIAPSLDGPSTVKVSATPIFAAPEVLNGARPTTSSDIYSLGTVLYGLIEGSPAYAGVSSDVVVHKVTSDGPVPAIHAEAPPELRALIANMMAKNAKERPATALDVGHHLVALQRQHDLSPTPILVMTDDVVHNWSNVEVSADSQHDVSRRHRDHSRHEAPTGDVQPRAESLTDRDTVTVGPVSPPTEILPHPPTPPGRGDQRSVQPGWRWPVIVAALSLLVFVVYWLATGQLIGDQTDTDRTEEATTAVTPVSIASWTGHTGLVGRIVWSPDGTRLATTGRDGLLRIWAVDDSGLPDGKVEVNELWSREMAAWILDVAWSENGTERLAVARSDGTISILSANDGDGPELTIVVSDTSVEVLSWDPSGQRLVVGDANGAVTLWSVDGTNVTLSQTIGSATQATLAAAWSPDGRLVATGGKDARIVVSDANSGEEQTVLVHNDWVRDLAWSGNGETIASASSDPALNTWSVSAGELIESVALPSDPIGGLEWSTDAELLLTGTESGESLLWVLGTAEATIIQKAVVPLSAVALSPNDSRWALGRGDGVVELWTVAGDN